MIQLQVYLYAFTLLRFCILPLNHMANPVRPNTTQSTQPIHHSDMAHQIGATSDSKVLQNTHYTTANYNLPSQNQSSYGVSIPPSLQPPAQGVNIDQASVHAALQALF